jgi:hypothetical protein
MKIIPTCTYNQKPSLLPRTYLKAQMLRGCYRFVRYY